MNRKDEFHSEFEICSPISNAVASQPNSVRLKPAATAGFSSIKEQLSRTGDDIRDEYSQCGQNTLYECFVMYESYYSKGSVLVRMGEILMERDV